MAYAGGMCRGHGASCQHCHQAGNELQEAKSDRWGCVFACVCVMEESGWKGQEMWRDLNYVKVLYVCCNLVSNNLLLKYQTGGGQSRRLYAQWPKGEAQKPFKVSDLLRKTSPS